MNPEFKRNIFYLSLPFAMAIWVYLLNILIVGHTAALYVGAIGTIVATLSALAAVAWTTFDIKRRRDHHKGARDAVLHERIVITPLRDRRVMRAIMAGGCVVAAAIVIAALLMGEPLLGIMPGMTSWMAFAAWQA